PAWCIVAVHYLIPWVQRYYFFMKSVSSVYYIRIVVTGWSSTEELNCDKLFESIKPFVTFQPFYPTFIAIELRSKAFTLGKIQVKLDFSLA
ncbi:MAG: hypothetical protein IJV25_09245, partial [Prevotella sp.]|nr:hypothetical protein [Prevotella sp.]